MSTALFMSCPNCRASISVSRAKVPIVIVCPECLKRFRFDADGEWEGSASVSSAGLGPLQSGLPWWQRRSVVANLLGGAAALLIIACVWWFLTTPSAAEMERKRERIIVHIVMTHSKMDGLELTRSELERKVSVTRAIFKDDSYEWLLSHAKEIYGYNE